MAKIVCEKCGTEYKYEVAKDFECCPVCGASMLDDNSSYEESPNKNNEEAGWITWYYYRDPEYGGYSLWDKLPNDPDALTLIKEFKAPPETECGLDKVKEILRTYIPDAFVYPEKEQPVIRCPRCMSKEYTLMNKGYSLFTGLLGSGRVKRVCNYCKKEF